MLGWEIYVYPSINKLKKEDVIVSWTSGMRGGNWIFDKMDELELENLGDAHGYPFRFVIKWSYVLNELKERKVGHSGIPVLGDDYVSSTGYQSELSNEVMNIDPAKEVVVELWDLS